MPIPDTTPPRKLVIRRGLIRYIVAEERYDTVVIEHDGPDGTETGTYKSLGFEILSAIENGQEVPYVKREHIAAVPGRQAVAAEQVEILNAAGLNIPTAVIKAAEPFTPADETPASATADAGPSEDTAATEASTEALPDDTHRRTRNR